MLTAPKRSPRVLLIIAPTLYECWHAAKEWGLTPGQIDNFRNVTKAIELRGVAPGTPFICINRQSWGATPEGFALDQALETLQRLGRVRPMGDDDRPNYVAYASTPSRASA
ncbi:hypothetical protein [Rhizobium sp. CNPSo 4039]|uniref:hypothetical protein n=1 Tax=Rhizobium sp. CNPSo 4039 TaxID=3021409 RepID=UPI00254F9114|nr:hypothetical protein [Rhizobium sp. CNPSo 4039]MDK4713008.1 hypothetical protein [Rhizobium sp. CNPSo 4039]